MIAKAILGMFTQLPEAFRSAAQNSDQPLQAFSDSLLAAAKSFSQESNSSDGSKATRRQSTSSGDAMASISTLAGNAGRTTASSQQTGTAATTHPLQSSFETLIAPEESSTGSGNTSGASQQATGTQATESSTGQTSVAASTVAQAKLNPVQFVVAEAATALNASTPLSTPVSRNFSWIGFYKTQSRRTQTGNESTKATTPNSIQSSSTLAQASATETPTTPTTFVQSFVQLSQSASLVESANTQAASTGTTSLAAMISASAANATPAQTEMSAQAIAQGTSTGTSSEPTRKTASGKLAESKTVAPPASSNTVSAITDQTASPADGLSSVSQALAPFAGIQAQNNSTVVTSQAAQNATAATPATAQAGVPQPSTNGSSPIQPSIVAAVQVQTPSAATTTASAEVVAENAQAARSLNSATVGMNPPTSVSVQADTSSIAPAVQRTPAQPAAGQDSSQGVSARVASPSISHVSTANPAGTQSTVEQREIPELVAVQSTTAPVAMPIAGSTAQSGLSAATGESAQVAVAADQFQNQVSPVAAHISLPASVQTGAASVQTAVAPTATAQMTSSDVVSQRSLSATAAVSSTSQASQPASTSVAPETPKAQLSSIPAEVSRPSFNSLRDSLAEPSMTTEQPNRTTGEVRQDFDSSKPLVAGSSSTQPEAASSSIASVQTPIAGPTIVANSSTAAVSQTNRAETTSATPIAHADSMTAGVFQYSGIQSNAVTAQADSAEIIESSALQTNSRDAAASLSQNATTAKPETQSNISPESYIAPTASLPVSLPSQNEQTPLAGTDTAQTTPSVQAHIAVDNANETPLTVHSTATTEPASVASTSRAQQTNWAGPATPQTVSIPPANQPAPSANSGPAAEPKPSSSKHRVTTGVQQPNIAQSKTVTQQPSFSEPVTGQSSSTATVVAPASSETAPKSADLEADAQSITSQPITEPSAHKTSVAATVTPVQAPTGVTNAPVEDSMQTVPTRSTVSAHPTEISQSPAAQATYASSKIISGGNDPSSVSASRLTPETQETTAPVTASSKSTTDDPSTVATSAVSDATPATNNTNAQESLPNTESNEGAAPVQNAAVGHTAQPVSAPHADIVASTAEVAASTARTEATAQAGQQAATPDQTPAVQTASAPDGTSNQVTSLPVSAAAIEVVQSSAPSFKPATMAKLQVKASTGDKSSSTDSTSAKKSVEPASNASAKTGSQDATASGNQNQSSNAPQAQNAAPVVNATTAPAVATAHAATVNATAQGAAGASTAHNASTSETSNSVAAKTAESNTPAAVSLPQAQPVINSAKLVQSMGQSEIRVGIRSNEFGNISISTSATKDQVSAQISLEHEELAKTLTTHLPEIQASLGSSQPADVRIDMNGAAAGQTAGSFGGTAEGSAGQSRGGRQQADSATGIQAGSIVSEQQLSPVATALPTGYARLDIRV